MIIVGAGMAGSQAALGMRQRGHAGQIVLVGDEPHLPYQRPPLSKSFLLDGTEPDSLLVRPATFYAEREIELRIGVRATEIDRRARTVTLDDALTLPYDHLVLATGSRNRTLPEAPGVHQLRTLTDARALRPQLAEGARVVLVGGGFIGLELAAAARRHGANVTVLEALDQLMARAVSPEMASALREEHERQGVTVLLGRRVVSLDRGQVTLDGGEGIHADLVVAGIGVVPNDELAAAAGLDVDDGVLVDAELRTTDPAISAIGDCARHPCPISGHRLRLESVQNATDHARCVAARLAGDGAAYRAVASFWTEQYDRRLQIAGVAEIGDQAVLRGDPADGGFSVCRFAAGRLIAVESLDRPSDHAGARKLLSNGIAESVTPVDVTDPGVDLKALASARR